jgi:hypothetical protein
MDRHIDNLEQITSLDPQTSAITTRPRFMCPCKSSCLDYGSLFDTSPLVKNKNGLCVPILLGPHKLGPDKLGQFVFMVKTLINVERQQIVHFYRTVYRAFVRKTKPKLQQK